MLKSTMLLSVEQTGLEMKRLALAYAGDMVSMITMTPTEVFEAIKDIPYQADPEDMEYLQRPIYTLGGESLGLDCDDKAIAVYAWATLRGFPARFVAVSREVGKPLHHVYTEVFMGGAWYPFDVTYAINPLFLHYREFSRQVIG